MTFNPEYSISSAVIIFHNKLQVKGDKSLWLIITAYFHANVIIKDLEKRGELEI